MINGLVTVMIVNAVMHPAPWQKGGSFEKGRSKGSLGGKARGLAFASSTIITRKLKKKFPEVTIKIPKTVVIGTNQFDEFMEVNNLWKIALKASDNEKIQC